jgi:hypothetical protein
MRDNESLERAQVDTILRRLVRESLWDSPTRAELLEDFRRSQPRAMDLLFGAPARRAILDLPEAAQRTVLDHLKTEAGARIVPVHPVLLKLGFKTPVFGGRPPVEFVVSGTLDGLLTVRRFLDATCRGEYMSASEVDAGFRGYRDVDIVFS